MAWLKALGWPAFFLAVGLGVGHTPMLASGFRKVEAELWDSRFINSRRTASLSRRSTTSMRCARRSRAAFPP